MRLVKATVVALGTVGVLAMAGPAMASDVLPGTPLVYAPVTGTVEKGAVDTDAPVTGTVEKGAVDADAPVTGTIEKGAVDTDVPVVAPISVNSPIAPIGSPDAGIGNG
ncbi:hypothetical protein ACH35V_27135 [Actinomadura sp. 1N219]|uniref:hypothetical protein n=1 Tax=Actinomadura sp. 1N219 TaxID=3375152 RepID=UPI0037BB0798